MAERRMFAKTIIDSDMFLDMPVTAQLLYFHLGMRADDDGFINNPKRIMRDVRSSDDDMKMLIAKNYIIPFESGVIVIKHWKIHNFIRTDRYRPSSCEEKALIQLNNNKAYEVSDTNGVQDDTPDDTPIGIPSGIPDDNQTGYQMETQVRLGKVRLGKVREYEGESEDTPPSLPESEKPPAKRKFTPPTIDEVRDYIKEKGLNVDADRFYSYYNEEAWHDSKGKPVKSWKQRCITWDNHTDTPKGKPQPSSGGPKKFVN